MMPLYAVKAKNKLEPPCSLLSAGKAQKMGTKAVSAEIPEPVAATPRRSDSTTLDSSYHSKESRLDHFGLINKFVLPSQSSSSPCHQSNNTQQLTTTEDQ